MTLLIREIECEAVSHKMDGSYYLYGFVVQWLGHAAVNRSIGVQVPAFPFGTDILLPMYIPKL